VSWLNKPTDEERGQWFSTLRQTLPPMEKSFFMTARCNRAGVQTGHGVLRTGWYLDLCAKPLSLNMLTHSGIKLYKYWFSVTQSEQARRFEARN
jgi:polyphosphate kinase 2 (PPK2 family)